MYLNKERHTIMGYITNYGQAGYTMTRKATTWESVFQLWSGWMFTSAGAHDPPQAEYDSSSSSAV